MQGEVYVQVSRGHEICDSSLNAMRYVETLNRARVLFPYLKEGDKVHLGTYVPTAAERITRRGPETLHELQTGLFIRHPKTKGKRKVSLDANKDDDLLVRMRGLEATQVETREEVRSLRAKVCSDIHSAKY
ncbi:hypothetical protein OROMI_017241 [Orobanche minor]